MAQLVYLRVGGLPRLLGQAFEPGDVPELLRHVADYYDDNPSDCEKLFSGTSDRPDHLLPASPLYLSDPFGGDYAGL